MCTAGISQGCTAHSDSVGSFSPLEDIGNLWRLEDGPELGSVDGVHCIVQQTDDGAVHHCETFIIKRGERLFEGGAKLKSQPLVRKVVRGFKFN